MNRRFFVTLAASTVIDPDSLLWVPGRKRYFIPAPPRIVSFSDDVWPLLERNLKTVVISGATQFTWRGPDSPALCRRIVADWLNQSGLTAARVH